MVSILITIIHNEQYFFLFQAHISTVCSFLSKSRYIIFESHVSSFSQSHATLFSSLMSHHWVNNKCDRVKRWHWKRLIYALRDFLWHNNMLCVFRTNHHCSWSFTNSSGNVGVSFKKFAGLHACFMFVFLQRLTS